MQRPVCGPSRNRSNISENIPLKYTAKGSKSLIVFTSFNSGISTFNNSSRDKVTKKRATKQSLHLQDDAIQRKPSHCSPVQPCSQRNCSNGSWESRRASGCGCLSLPYCIHQLCPLCTRYYSRSVVLNPPKMLQPFHTTPYVVLTSNHKIIFVATS